MPSSNTAISRIDTEIEDRLKDREMRYTTGRRAVVGAMTEADGPQSAAELHAVIGGAVPLSSIYRALSVLEEAGVAVPHLATKELARYELAEWLTGHHHHLVCIDCGAVQDIEIASGPERRLETIVAEVADQTSFRPVDHALEIAGRCRKCA